MDEEGKGIYIGAILSTIASQQPLTMYETAFLEMRNWKDKEWKDSLVAMYRIANASLSSDDIGRGPPWNSWGAMRSWIWLKTASSPQHSFRTFLLKDKRSSIISSLINVS